jgi:hypothetical protein
MAHKSYQSDGSTYQYVVSAVPCRFIKLTGMNGAATTRYLRVYDKATAANPASDTPILRFKLFPNGGIKEEYGRTPVELSNVSLANGLSIVVTAGAADTDTTAASANDVAFNVIYK